MEEEGTTSVSEVGTSLPGDLEIGISIAGLGKSFGTELQRNMLTRKQSVEQLTRHALKVTQRQVTSLWSQQHMTRKQLLSEFRQNLLQEVYSLEADCSKCNDAEEKVLACIKQQQKVIDSCKQSQGKRLQNIHVMRDEFMGTLTALDANERGHLSTIRETMRGEIQALQKKLLQQSQRQEMNQVKRAMQTLFL
ncbi:Synaptonemal complex protein 3 [Lamellibrachia satsuma]|nr:Synaptonemal complex protein 3 [Lamellibrachia satsuma]